MRVVILFKSLWLGTLYKWPLDCAPIFRYAWKLCFCIIYVPIIHAVFLKGLELRPFAYTYAFGRGLRLRLYAVKLLRVYLIRGTVEALVCSVGCSML